MQEATVQTMCGNKIKMDSKTAIQTQGCRVIMTIPGKATDCFVEFMQTESSEDWNLRVTKARSFKKNS